MKNFQIFRYLKKWMPLVALFFVVMTAVAYRFLAGKQEYVASAVIRYKNEEAIDGLAPDGSEIDVAEINSSDIIAQAMKNLGLNLDDYSVEELCASIAASPILQEDTVVIQEALNEEGERYTEKPTEYAVTCTMGSDSSEDFVRNLLNEVLDVYFSEYSSEHINHSQISNDVKGIVAKNYDYLELVEKIGDELSETINELNNYINSDNEFRSSRTGYSFLEIQSQFILLHDVNLYRLYSLILGNQITRDEEILTARYLDRIAEYSLDGRKAREEIDDSNRIINSYVEKMRNSGNTNIDFNYILDEVYDKNKDDETETETRSSSRKFTDVDRTVEYDTLLENWVDAKDDLDKSLIDEAYSKYILGIYQSEEGAAPTADKILAELEETEKEIQASQQPDTGAAPQTGAAEVPGTASAEGMETPDTTQDGGTASIAAAQAADVTKGSAADTENSAAAQTDETKSPAAAQEAGAAPAEVQTAETAGPDAAQAGGTEIPGAVQTGSSEFSDEISAEQESTAQAVVSRKASPDEIESEINELLLRMDELYMIADETSDEYNEYLGALNIQTLTSVIAQPALNLKLYIAIIAVVFLIIGCCGAILAGRIGDILEYVFLRDAQTGCMNRVSCDNYIQGMSKKILPGGFCCVNLLLRNQRELNAAIGREKADDVLAQMGQTLKDIFGNRKNSFIGYNGSGQFWTFFEDGNEEGLEQELGRFAIVMKDRFGEYPVTYALGGVNAGEAGDYQLRSLISKSVTGRKEYMTGQESKES